MIKMRLWGQQNFDIAELKPKHLHMPADHRIRSCHTCIDQDMTFRGSEEVTSQVIGPDKIKVAGNPEWRVVQDPGWLEVMLYYLMLGICLRQYKLYGNHKAKEEQIFWSKHHQN